MSDYIWRYQELFVQSIGVGSSAWREFIISIFVSLRQHVWKHTWLTWRNMEERASYLLHKLEVHSLRVPLHSSGKNALCFVLDHQETEALFVFLYYILHFYNWPAEAYFPKGDADRKVSKIVNTIEWNLYCVYDPKDAKSTSIGWSSCRKSCWWKVWIAQDLLSQ